MLAYRAFGLTIASDRRIPALEGVEHALAPGIAPDIRIELLPGGSVRPPDARLWHQSPADPSGEILRILECPAGSHTFVYSDGCEILIDPEATTIRLAWPQHLTLEDAAEYLLGPAMGFALRARGIVCLHASAVAAGDSSFAVLAPGGHGKSTTAAACARRGLAVLTDDILALRQQDGEFWAQPAYPRVRLWPEAVEGLFGAADALPRIAPRNASWDKRYLELSGPQHRFQDEPLPLRVVYTHEREEAERAVFETLPAPAALVALIANVYSRCRPEPPVRAAEFDFLQRLARQVPVRRFRGRFGLEHLDGHCALLAADCRRSASARAATAGAATASRSRA